MTATVMKERFRASDYRFLVICLAILAGTVWYSTRNFFRAFPEASIDFRVSRDDAQGIAARFLADRGYHLEGYRRASSFTYDDNAKTFLEREAGLEQANRLMSTRIRMWRWSHRWFRPQQKEEFRASITPAGELAGFTHLLAEDAARPEASAAQARTLAEDFLRARMRRAPATLEFVEGSDVTRPHRVDRVFTWKERDFSLHDATYRLEVTLLGNEVGGYREYLKVPEQWTRDYERLRSRNEFAQTIDTAVLLLLLLGMIVVIVMRIRRQDIRWRRAAAVGAVGMVLAFCASLNQFPLQEFGYPTTDSYSSFAAHQLLEALLTAVGAGGLLFVLTAGAEPLYRQAYPGQMSLGQLFRPRGMRTRRFFLGAVLGITLAGVFVAYQTGFYILAYRFGAWSPADVPYDDLLNTRFPWLYVLFGGFLPAVSEEFLFRMFAIPFLRKIGRSLAVAVVLAGFIWGFGHAGYPQQPFFIRGVEVGIGGIALGLIMLRWGILPTLVWHYSVDAMYGAMLLVRSHSLYFKFSGAASAGIMVLPLVAALVAYWLRGGFEPDTGLLNSDEAAAAEPPPAPAPEGAGQRLEYRPLSPRLRLAVLAIFALGLLTLLIPATRFGASPVYKLSSDQARARAEAFLRAQNFNTALYRYVTYPDAHWGGDDSLAAKYFLEREALSAASARFERERPVQHWVTRYFKSLDQEEALATVHPETGRLMGFQHTIPEDRPGADISDDQARAIAAAFAAAQGQDVGAMDLKESLSEKKKARRDHTLAWEARPGDARNLDEAHYRVEVTVAGDQVTAWRSFWKIPETFSRRRSQNNWLSIVVLSLNILAIVGAVVCGLWLLIGNIRHSLVRWGTVIRLAILPTLLAAVGAVLSLSLLYENYNTAIPLETYQAVGYTALAMSVLMAALIFGAAVALVTSFYPGCVAAMQAPNRRILGLDAGAATLAAFGLATASVQFKALLSDRFHAQALLSIGSPDLIVSAAPAVSAIAGAVRTALVDAAILAVIALVLRHLPKRWMMAPVLLLALFALLSTDIRTPGEFALQYGGALLTGACVALFCWCFARANFLAYVLAIWIMALRSPLVTLFDNGNASLARQGWMVAAVLAVTLLWALLPALRRKPL